MKLNEEIQMDKVVKKDPKDCSHPKDKQFTYNHGYHKICTLCGEELE